MKSHFVRRRIPLLLAAALGLAACGGDDPGQADRASAPSAGDAPSAKEDLPTCREMYRILGDFTVDLLPESQDGAGDGIWGDPRKYGVSCAWVTSEATKALHEAIKTSGVAVQVIIETDPVTEADYRAMGWVADDPRVDAIGGVLVVPGGKLDLGANLGIAGVAVVVDRTYVSVAAGGVNLGRNDSARNLTYDRGIDAAIAVHRALGAAQ